MVLEFDSMQGIAGRYYAEHDGEPGDVAAALEEQYRPKFAGDQLPQSDSGRALALADRLDTLVGIWTAGKQPTGSKDPFALRRAALGVLRILGETPLDLDLDALLDATIAGYPPELDAASNKAALLDFFRERFKVLCLDRGYSRLQFEAAASVGYSRPADLLKRLHAVQLFSELDASDSLSAADKRIRNIFKKIDANVLNNVDASLFEDELEKNLHQTLIKLQESSQLCIERSDYETALKTLAELKAPVDAFFDGVMVMAEDEALRQNRLALLAQLRGLFLQIADLSQLQE
ncbi:glycyl-tRNA synthetase [gamma proteobacterium HTCC5015]|nr:glycyl-tRNA synthetase [gamma proteobacterium HTCC5015]